MELEKKSIGFNVELVGDFYHDLQYFIKSLIEQTVVLRKDENNNIYLRERLRLINSFAIAMDAKTSYLKYISVKNDDIPYSEIFPYRVVDKFRYAVPAIAAAMKKQIGVQISGTSFSSIEGPDVFDFIPYAIIENCIKYAPSHSKIRISVLEDNKSIRFEFNSSGPELEENEEQLIFNKGYRGKNVLKTQIKGSGQGLYYATQAIKRLFNGSIRVIQRKDCPAVLINGIPFRDTTFSLDIPF
jgi:Histidine kinase-, DNA gyrase B-, and HSP90-like ATPase